MQKMSVKKTNNTGKLLSVIVMSVCLMLLTGINFVLYPETNRSIALIIHSSGEICGDETPQVPTEEKSAENSSTIHEDFLHEYDYYCWLLSPIPALHKLMSADKLEAIHFELISPPPDC